MSKSKYVLNRLKEPSTWASVGVLTGVVGSTFSPESQDAAVEFFKSLGQFIGTAIAFIGIFWKKDSQVKE